MFAQLAHELCLIGTLLSIEALLHFSKILVLRSDYNHTIVTLISSNYLNPNAT